MMGIAEWGMEDLGSINDIEYDFQIKWLAT